MLRKSNSTPDVAMRARIASARRPAIIGIILLFGFFYVENLHRILGTEHLQVRL